MSDTAEAASVQAAILAAHSARHMKGPKQTLPNGIIISTLPYVGFRHPGENVGKMLGDPSRIMRQTDELREKLRAGYLYAWLSRRDVKTTTKLRAKQARAVTMDEIDPANDEAEVIEIVTPTGSGVVWENMLLCELPPKVAQRRYRVPEQQAIAQFAEQPQAFEHEVEESTKGDYRGSFQIKDPLVGR